MTTVPKDTLAAVLPGSRTTLLLSPHSAAVRRALSGETTMDTTPSAHSLLAAARSRQLTARLEAAVVPSGTARNRVRLTCSPTARSAELPLVQASADSSQQKETREMFRALEIKLQQLTYRVHLVEASNKAQEAVEDLRGKSAKGARVAVDAVEEDVRELHKEVKMWLGWLGWPGWLERG